MMFNNEVWVDIPDYKEYYQVSNKGRIKSLRSNNRILKQCIDSYGYCTVGLNVNGVKKSHKIHRLVMYGFSGYSKLQVNHKDYDKQNNTLSNLEYCTQSENEEHKQKALKKSNLPHGILLRYNGKYSATKNVKGKRKWVGTFNTINDAIDARNEYK